MKSGVYKITIGEHFYIGSAVNLDRRRVNHLSDLRRKVHSNLHMQNCWLKHQDFKFEVLELASPEEVLEVEQRFLDEHFNDPMCLNIRPMAENKLGCKLTPETRQRMREAQLGKRHSEQTRRKISELQSGRSLTPEWREAISQAHTGMRRSDEARKAMSDAARNRTPEHRANISKAKTGDKNPMYGKSPSEETRRKRSEAMKRTIAEKRASGEKWPKSA